MYLRPAHLREANTRRVFRALLARPRCSRAELARRTGLSGVTAGRVVDALKEAGLVVEVETPPPTDGATLRLMGRPPQMVALSPRPRFLGIEIGVRETRIAALPLAGPDPELPCRTIPTPDSLDAFLGSLRKAKASVGLKRCDAVLVSVPGVVDQGAGAVLFSPNLHWSEGAELLHGIGAQNPAPVIAVQEIQALALGHQAAEGSESFLLLDFSEGVGGAVVMQGHLLTGEISLSGEIGHTPVMNNGRRCGCGAVGCLETLASRNGLLRSFREAHGNRRADWTELARHVARFGIEPWLDQAIDATGVVVAGAINLLGIGHVIVTGDLPSLHVDITERLRASIEEHSLLGRFGRVACATAPRRRWLGLIVAASKDVLAGGGDDLRPGIGDRRKHLYLAV